MTKPEHQSDEVLLYRLSLARAAVEVGGTYVHRKSSRMYHVQGVRLRESDLEVLVDYCRFDMPLPWSRPLDEFLEGFSRMRVGHQASTAPQPPA